MIELYNKSIKELKQCYNKPSVKGWTKLAKEKNLMSTKTMCLISNLNWNQLCNSIRNKNHKNHKNKIV